MAQACSICTHTQRTRIDEAIVNQQPNRRIAAQFGLTERAVRHHRRHHLPETLVKAQQAQDMDNANILLQQLIELKNKALALLEQAEQAGDLRTALQGVRETRTCLETLLEIQGKLNRQPQVNVLLSPEFAVICGAFLEALHPWPDARVAVAAALDALEADHGHRG